MPRHVSSGTAPAGAEADGAEQPAPRARVRRLRPPASPATGRERHDEKITVYVSADELVALEQARLVLRAEHSIAVDRGRLVREAIAGLLRDLDQHGDDSEVVARLREPS